MRTTVVNAIREPYDIYIGRGTLTPVDRGEWGNPYKIGRDGTRREVIDKYRAYILSRPDLLKKLPELKGKRLGCWCAPLECHGHVLVELIEGAEQPSLF